MIKSPPTPRRFIAKAPTVFLNELKKELKG
jgi:hypothetical protein